MTEFRTECAVDNLVVRAPTYWFGQATEDTETQRRSTRSACTARPSR